MTIYVNARAVIERAAENGLDILLQRRVRPGEPVRWELPGGQIDLFEPVAAALEREIREETGLTLVQIDGNDQRRIHESGEATVETFQPFFAYQTIRGPVDSLGFFFRCRATGELLVSGDDTAQPTWFNVQALKGMFEDDPDQFDWLTRAALERYLDVYLDRGT
jgi:8-oxo-dGTP diphosphatase